MCASCLGEVAARTPRVRCGERRARVHHISCAAARCGPLQSLPRWLELGEPAQTAALADYDSRSADANAVGDSAAVADEGDAPMADVAVDAGAAAAPEADVPAAVVGQLHGMEFWRLIPFDRLHDRVRTVKIVPEALRPAVADLR